VRGPRLDPGLVAPARRVEGAGVSILKHRVNAALALVVVLSLTACVSATPQKRAYQALDTIATTVDGGMQVAAALYKEGRVYDPAGKWVIVSPADVLVTDAQWDKLAGIHEKYRLAGKAAAISIKALGPDAHDISAILSDVNAAATEVLALIELFKKGGA